MDQYFLGSYRSGWSWETQRAGVKLISLIGLLSYSAFTKGYITFMKTIVMITTMMMIRVTVMAMEMIILRAKKLCADNIYII